MQLWLKPALAQAIVEHARATQPEECCGVIVGVGEEAQQVIPIVNIADEPREHYHLDDQALLAVLLDAQRQHLDVIGFYHSHPVSDPIPSQTDIRLATYPDAAYVIASLKDGEARLAAWSIKRHQVVRIDLIVSEAKPEPETPSLTLVQKRAIIASAIIAFIFMLVLSLSLLPPAPIIPTP